MGVSKADLEMRIKLANSNLANTNCIGTALFLVGEQPTDTLVEPELYAIHKPPLLPLKEPVYCALVTWEEKRGRGTYVNHMGLVTNADPVLVTHREEWNAPVVENEPIDEITKRYKGDIRFYLSLHVLGSNASALLEYSGNLAF